jgi:hypothetical protein
MKFKVKIVEATSPYDLEKYINEVLEDPEYVEYDVKEIKHVVTMMPGAKVSRGGMFYMASILFIRK